MHRLLHILGTALCRFTHRVIKYIFSLGSKVKFAVYCQLNCAHDTVDPYTISPHFPAKLYLSKLADTLEVVGVEWVFSHFARYNVSDTEAVVLSLSHDLTFK